MAATLSKGRHPGWTSWSWLQPQESKWAEEKRSPRGWFQEESFYVGWGLEGSVQSCLILCAISAVIINMLSSTVKTEVPYELVFNVVAKKSF